MTPRPLHRSPLLFLLGATALVACSDASTGTFSMPHHRTATSGGGTASGGDGTSTGTGDGTPTSGSTGAPSGATPSGSNGGSGSQNQGTGSSGNPSNPSNPGTPETPPAPAVAFDVLVDNAAPAVNLAEETTVQVTVAPQGGWTGAVSLSVDGLPSDVTATFDNATVNLASSAGATAKLTLTTVSSSAPVTSAFNVVGTVGSVVHKVAANVTVKPEITIKIPVNVDALSPGFGTIKITAPDDIANNPVTVNFLNLDSTPHEIHADKAGEGFPHGKGTFGQNQMDAARKIIAKDTFNFYLHDENNPSQNPGKIIVQ